MNMMATITSKKQLTLPSEIFKKAGLKMGQKVIVSEKNGRLTITSAEMLVEKLAGSVAIPKKLRGQNLDKIIETAKKNYFRDHKK